MFTCVPVWGTPPGYTLVIEWPAALDLAADEFAARMERELSTLNIEYAEKRRGERLAAICVLPVKPGTFSVVEERRRLRGASPAQLKHHWIQRNDDFLQHVPDFAIEPAAG